MPCCAGGKPCGGPTYSRDDVLPSSVEPASGRPRTTSARDWAAAPNGTPQFDDYGDGLKGRRPADEDDDAADAEEGGPPFEYAGRRLQACHFPLGSLGTGRVLLCGDGALKEWTVVNQCRSDDGGPGDAPRPLDDMPANFFAVKAAARGSEAAAQTYALVTPQNYTATNMALSPRREAHVSGHDVGRMSTLPGVRSLTMRCRYPIAEVTYDVPGLPVEVSLEALSPAIPGDSDGSCIPAAVFQFTLVNSGTAPVEVSLMEAQQNFIGWDGQLDCTTPGTIRQWGGNVNTPYRTETVAGLSMSSVAVAPATPDIFGTLAVAGAVTPGTTIRVIPRAGSEEELFAMFEAGNFQPPTAAATLPSAAGTSWCGGVVQTVTVPAGATRTVDFILAWHFPNRSRQGSCGAGRDKILPEIIGNYYDNLFTDAPDVVSSVRRRLDYLRGFTRLYTDTLYGSTVPPDLLDSAAGRLAVARSATMWRNASGIVLGCEGNGCCPLNCTHVYGYATLLERLFPDLAMDMCVSNFVRNFDPEAGGATMRYGAGGWAIDGALACVIKAYLCVRQTDSTKEFLSKVWPNVKAQMGIVMEGFDDGTGVIRVAQQNTYDTAMFGANTFIGSYWVTALRAAAEMATLMNDAALAHLYSTRAEMAAENYDEICWREEFGYYVADVTLDNCANSYGPGCFVDQLCCVGLSSACGFGHVFNPWHERSAREAIRKHNVVTQASTESYVDMQHHFFPGDTGITVCTYPHGKLADGMRDADLVSSGFTSPVIAGMVLDRDMEGALDLAGRVRRRHDGRNRSPWNEPECGLLYARAMAHWNIYDQACGHVYDCTSRALAFDPRTFAAVDGGGGGDHSFKCFVSLEGGWGEFSQTGPPGMPSGKLRLSCLWGTFNLKTLTVISSAKKVTANIGCSEQAVTLAAGRITFTNGLTLKANATVEVDLGGGLVERGRDDAYIITQQVHGRSRQRRAANQGLGDTVVADECCTASRCKSSNTCSSAHVKLSSVVASEQHHQTSTKLLDNLVLQQWLGRSGVVSVTVLLFLILFFFLSDFFSVYLRMMKLDT